MRILVVSDSHGRISALREVLELHGARDVIFLGDGLRDVEEMEALYPDRRFYKVAGNCDFGANEPTTGHLELAGRRIFYTHGHAYYVKHGLGEFKAAARRAGADIALYGHTHEAFCTYEDGLYIMNPGAVSGGETCYGLIDITPAGVVVHPEKL
ncbi:MAG: metallophosphoesterase family protein [Candidatus Howiella sp.]|jgi:putative phosphoesterase